MELFRFHSFDNLSPNWMCSKLDPCFSMDFSRKRKLSRLLWALRAGGIEARRFEELLLNICIRMLAIDGMVSENELETVRRLFVLELRSILTRERVIEVCDCIGSEMQENSLNELINTLNQDVRRLDYLQKDLLLDLPLKVATANGRASENQKNILYILASSLGVPEIIVHFRLYYLERNSQSKRSKENDKWPFS